MKDFPKVGGWMSAPEWWVIALPALAAVGALIGVLYSYIKNLFDIKKAQLDIEKAKLELEKLKLEPNKIELETEKLSDDRADRHSRIVRPTASDIEKYVRGPAPPPRPPASYSPSRSGCLVGALAALLGLRR
jgi:hypothetical protein